MTVAVHRGWMSVKDVLAGTGDPEGVLDAAEQGEDHAKSDYAEALEADISPELRTVVERQYTAVQHAHDLVRDLRDLPARRARTSRNGGTRPAVPFRSRGDCVTMLVRALLGFVRLALGPGLLGLGFLLGDVPLGLGLALLGLALVTQVVVVRDGADGLLGLALDVLDDALGPASGPVSLSGMARTSFIGGVVPLGVPHSTATEAPTVAM